MGVSTSSSLSSASSIRQRALKQTQLAKLDSAPMREELERAFATTTTTTAAALPHRKLPLRRDIQPIPSRSPNSASSSPRLRQQTNRNKKDNHGIARCRIWKPSSSRRIRLSVYRRWIRWSWSIPASASSKRDRIPLPQPFLHPAP